MSGLIRKFRRRPAAHFVVLAVSLVLTGLSGYYSHLYNDNTERFKFEAYENDIAANVIRRFDAYVAMLRSAAGFYDASDIDRERWREFTDTIDVKNAYPGLRGLGFSSRFPSSELGAVVRSQKSQGLADFKVTPSSPIDGYYDAILYLEPYDARNAAAIGFNMYSEKVRREAMDRARRTGEPAMSGKVTLVQEIDENKQPGFLIYYPVYSKRVPADTEEERLREHKGYVYLPVRVYDYMEATFQRRPLPDPEIRVRIYDESASPENLMYSHGDWESLRDGHLAGERRIEFAGRMWVIQAAAPSGFTKEGDSYATPYILLGGTLLSFVLFALTRSQVRERRRAERAAARLAFVSESSKVLSGSEDVSSSANSIARAAVPHVADWCVICLAEGVSYRPIAFEHVKSGIELDAGKVCEALHAGGENGFTKMLESGRAEAFQMVTARHRGADAFDAEAKAMLGALKAVSVAAAPVRVGGSTVGLIAVGREHEENAYRNGDILMLQEVADRIALALERARLFDELKRAIVARDEFMSMASHELKTPLTSQKILIQYLGKLAKDGGHSQFESLSSKLLTQTERLASLIIDLIDVTKLEAGKLRFEMKPLDLDELVREACDEAKLTTDRHAIELKGSLSRRVFADRDRIHQVLSNLLSNAVKYSPEAERVEVAVAEKDGAALVCVRDFGIGISSEDQDRLFSRFYRVSGSDERTFSGMGLGLYISAEIVKRHGGKIWVESEKGKGSTFCFTVPLA